MKYLVRAALLFVPLFLIGEIFVPVSEEYSAAKAVPYEEQKDGFENFEDVNKQDSGLPTNPMELMRLLEKYSSMNKSTEPSDAIDQALEVFNEQSEQNFSINN